MTKSEENNYVESIRRYTFSFRATRTVYRHWITKYAILCTLLTVAYRLVMAQWLAYFLFEIQYFSEIFIHSFLAIFRYMTLLGIIIASFYAFLQMNVLKAFGYKAKCKESVRSANIEASTTTEYSVSVLKEPDTKTYNGWEKTVEDCWFNLNIASVCLKSNNDKLAAGVKESKEKLKEIKKSLQTLENRADEEHTETVDAASNTDPIDFHMMNSKIDSSEAEITPSESSVTSSEKSTGIKYNILEKVIEMGENLSFEAKDTTKRFRSKSNILRNPLKSPRISPIQQWSMPKDIFSFSSSTTIPNKYL